MTQSEDKYRVASTEEVRKFFEHALAVFMSDSPADSHVVIQAPVLLAIQDHLDACVSGPFSEAQESLLPEAVVRYADTFSGTDLKFSDLCIAGVLAEKLLAATYDGAPGVLCVPKYMMEALFHILIDPAFAKRAREWFSIQDYE